MRLTFLRYVKIFFFCYVKKKHRLFHFVIRVIYEFLFYNRSNLKCVSWVSLGFFHVFQLFRIVTFQEVFECFILLLLLKLSRMSNEDADTEMDIGSDGGAQTLLRASKVDLLDPPLWCLTAPRGPSRITPFKDSLRSYLSQEGSCIFGFFFKTFSLRKKMLGTKFTH